MKFLITTWFLAVLSITATSQEKWINYTSNNQVTDIEEAENGLWIGSHGGLCFVDFSTGEEVYYNRGNSQLPTNPIYDLLLHPNNDLWITTPKGLSILRNEQFIHVSKHLNGVMRLMPDEKVVIANFDSLYIQSSDLNFKSIPYPNYMAGIGGIEVDADGTIYVNMINFFSETYVARYKNDKWEIMYSDNIYGSAITMDSKHTLWFLNDKGLHYWASDTWNHAVSIDSLEASSIRSLHVDIDDNIIIEVEGSCSRLLAWNRATLAEIDFAKGACKDCRFIKPSKQKKDSYFASNYTEGLYKFSKESKGDFKKYAQSPLLHNHIVTTLHPDDGSHLVVYHNSIQVIQNGHWSTLALPGELTKNIRFAYLANDKVYITDSENIWFFTNSTWKKHELPSSGLFSKIEKMYIAKDETIWIQHGTYIARYKDDWTVFGTDQHKISNSIVKDMIVNEDTGDLWVSTFQGVRHYDGHMWHRYDFAPVNHAFSLAGSNDGVYVHKSELYFIKNGRMDSIPMPPVGEYGSFVSEMIYDRDKERLYLSGIDHLAVLENGNWEVYTSDNSKLYNGFSNDLNMDKEGNLWLSGSGGGLAVFNPDGIASSVIDIEKEKIEDIDIVVFPTMVENNQLRIMSAEGGLFELVLLDLKGKEISKNQISLKSMTPSLYQLPNCPAGMYVLKFSNERGSTSKKVIKLYH